MSFNAIRENKILAKISEFTVLSTTLKFKYEMRNEIKLEKECYKKITGKNELKQEQQLH